MTGEPTAVRAVVKIPATPDKKPAIAYTLNLKAFTFIPDKRTASSLLPMAIIIRPKTLYLRRIEIIAKMIKSMSDGFGMPRELPLPKSVRAEVF
jgi:hypothetical protein